MAYLRGNINGCVHETSYLFVAADLRRNRSQEVTARSHCDETLTLASDCTLVRDSKKWMAIVFFSYFVPTSDMKSLQPRW